MIIDISKKLKIMHKKIRSMVMDQKQLIEPIISAGTTSAIKCEAYKEYYDLDDILQYNLASDDVIKKHKDTLLECCTSLYNKLCEDSRTLPSSRLREISKNESENIMAIWKYIENL